MKKTVFYVCRSFISIIFPKLEEEATLKYISCRSFISIIFPGGTRLGFYQTGKVSILYKYHISL